MSRADYRRPANYQVNIIYRCDTCGKEIEQASVYGVGQCQCGGTFQECGESYPASPDEQIDGAGEAVAILEWK